MDANQVNILLIITSTLASILFGLSVYFLKDLHGSIKDLDKSVKGLQTQLAVMTKELEGKEELQKEVTKSILTRITLLEKKT